MRLVSILIILVLTLAAFFHIIFSYIEMEYLLFLKQQKLGEINRVKKNIHLYNTKIQKLKSDREYFMYLVKRKYKLLSEKEYYLDD